MNEDKKTNTGGLDTAPDFENFEKADVSEELLEEANGKYRDLKGFPRYLAFGIAVATTLIIFYTAFAGVFLPMVQRSIIISAKIAWKTALAGFRRVSRIKRRMVIQALISSVR